MIGPFGAHVRSLPQAMLAEARGEGVKWNNIFNENQPHHDRAHISTYKYCHLRPLVMHNNDTIPPLSPQLLIIGLGWELGYEKKWHTQSWV